MSIKSHRTHHSVIARTLIGSLLLSSLLVITPTVVMAGPHQASAPQTTSTTVSLADFNLATSAGLSAARERLAVAAKRLCRKFSDSRKVDDYETQVDCYRETLANALQLLNAKLATAAARTEGSEVARNIH
jgi:UrcA family protein